MFSRISIRINEIICFMEFETILSHLITIFNIDGGEIQKIVYKRPVIAPLNAVITGLFMVINAD